jgi:hypothetical protein
MRRWCRWCADWTYEGSHNAQGYFDQYSVEVSERDIAFYVAQNYRRGYRSPEQVRWNISYGLHLGTFIPAHRLEAAKAGAA